jgi:diguanylate cyclase (GGDEF)-like protein
MAQTDIPSESIDWKLVEYLYDQAPVLIVGSLVPMTVAALGFARTSQSWFIAWGISATLVLIGRISVNAAFPRRRIRTGPPTVWRRRFLIGTWANGAVCGSGAAGSVLLSDAFTQMLVITMLTSFMMGSAARNGVYPKAAIGSILWAGIPLLLACLATRDIYYEFYTLFILLFSLSAIWVVRHLYTQTVRLLTTDEEKAVLVGEISRSNRELAAVNETLAAANEKLAAIASTDGLTGLPNRRRFDDLFEPEAASARRNAVSDAAVCDLSLLMIDIDWFKGYNDRYGHQAGDECLRSVGRTLAAGCRRPRDVLARYGGEEFIAILPETTGEGAAAVAETLRESIEALGIEHAASAFPVVTISIGVATLSRSAEMTCGVLIERADDALYRAKAAGRNRVHTAPDIYRFVESV